GVSTDEVRCHVEAAPRSKNLFDEALHCGAISWVSGTHQHPRVGPTGQVTKRVAQSGAFRLISEGYRDVSALLELRAQHRRPDVAGGARKYYGAPSKIEHPGPYPEMT